MTRLGGEIQEARKEFRAQLDARQVETYKKLTELENRNAELEKRLANLETAHADAEGTLCLDCWKLARAKGER